MIKQISIDVGAVRLISSNILTGSTRFLSLFLRSLGIPGNDITRAMIVALVLLFLRNTGMSVDNPRSAAGAKAFPIEKGVRSKRDIAESFVIECDDHMFTISTLHDVDEFRTICPQPKVLKLSSSTSGVLPAGGLKAHQFYSFVNAPEIHMCIRIEYSSLRTLDLSNIKRIIPTCRGPALRIYGNAKLQTIKLHYTFMRRAELDSVFIRGNRVLSASDINIMKSAFPEHTADIQEPGECELPPVFENASSIDGCRTVYGTMFINGNVGNITRSPMASGYDLIGCLEIYETDLEDVDFLDDVRNFTLLSGTCEHVIVSNPHLCIKHPLKLKKKFGNLTIDQRMSTKCETTCEGGVVNETFLQQLSGCHVVEGDLVFKDMEKRPSHFHHLDDIRKINGTLRVTGTKNLGDFVMDNLQEITVPEQGKAIEITGNSGIRVVSFPRLRKINASDHMKVVIVNNAKLGMRGTEVKSIQRISSGEEHTKIEFTDISSLIDKVNDYKLFIIMALMIFLIILLIALIATVLAVKVVKKRQAYNKQGFPNPPYRLGKESKEILLGWVKEIVDKNPLIWRSSDRPLIWAYCSTDGMHKDIDVLVANNSSFLKDHMLPLASNARLPDDSFLLTERVKAMIAKEIVIMIGSEKEPNCILPKLPYEVNKEHTYKYRGSTYYFKVKNVKKMAPSTTLYVYNVVVTPKGKKAENHTLKVYYYRWERKKTPTEFDEILQLAMVYKPEKTICVSDRRKEAFSLIHMFFVYCYVTKENISLKDAFQLHTEKCNGSMLDRSEMMYAMAVIMEWAYQSRTIKDQDLKRKHMDWCHSYAIMARFERSHSNIKYIHPDYLTKLDPDVRQRVIHDGFNMSPRFSPRDSCAVLDPFARKGVRDSAHVPLNDQKKQDEEKSRKTDKDKPGSEKDEEEFWTKAEPGDAMHKQDPKRVPV
ncbi:hypothetical protein Q1695_010417 [Nippostrongylus brasiliensis]|nr:hypothetical protein Q1695_010417 [Nippostrongylus brasiliensis]